ncbi:hypothetical protein U9M48_001449 [Paspalum notatum var. saurae]|uniref:Uncharacterized protein n=1 Tax=Paspalum notatum var. saurae TaxID=547442 RepID=A0AAQ3SCY2_PASNO
MCSTGPRGLGKLPVNYPRKLNLLRYLRLTAIVVVFDLRFTSPCMWWRVGVDVGVSASSMASSVSMSRCSPASSASSASSVSNGAS